MATAAPAIKIGPADNGRRMTLAEFLDAEEAPGYRYELASGVIEVSEVPNDPHGDVVDKIHTQFSIYRLANPGLIRRVSEASGVQIVIEDPDTDRHPDLSIIFHGKAPDDRGRCMPDLVVEVVSQGKQARDRDYVAKREDYLSSGILEYRIVDPLVHRVTVLSRLDAGAEWTERYGRDRQPASAGLRGGRRVALVGDRGIRSRLTPHQHPIIGRVRLVAPIEVPVPPAAAESGGTRPPP